MKKALLAVLVAVATLVSAAAPVKAEAPESFTSVTYKFDCTTFVAEDTIKVTNQMGSWSGFSADPEYTVTAAGAFEITGTLANAETGFKNMGYLSSTNAVANIYKMTAIVIADVEFVFQGAAATQVEALDASSSTANGGPNIWNDAGKLAVIAQSAKGSTIGYDATADAIVVTWSATEFAPQTGDASAFAVYGVMAVVAVAVLAVSKKRTVVE